jgi:hypothetical protein
MVRIGELNKWSELLLVLLFGRESESDIGSVPIGGPDNINWDRFYLIDDRDDIGVVLNDYVMIHEGLKLSLPS